MIIFFIIYIISVIGMWYWIHLAHSKGGKYSFIKVSKADIILTFFPVYNTILMFISWAVEYPLEKTETKKEINYNKFFKIK